MGSRFAIPNQKPPIWLQEVPRPACFGERDWAAWAEAARQAAHGGEKKAMRRGKFPSPCEDCDGASEHRSKALRAGTCVPVFEQTDATNRKD